MLLAGLPCSFQWAMLVLVSDVGVLPTAGRNTAVHIILYLAALQTYDTLFARCCPGGSMAGHHHISGQKPIGSGGSPTGSLMEASRVWVQMVPAWTPHVGLPVSGVAGSPLARRGGSPNSRKPLAGSPPTQRGGCSTLTLTSAVCINLAWATQSFQKGLGGWAFALHPFYDML